MMFKNAVNRYIRASLLILAALMIQACFHSKDNSPAPVVPDVNATGYYTGSVSVRAVNDTDLFEITDAQILINGTRMMIVSDTQAILYDGELVITGNDFTSTVTIYQDGSNVGYTTTVEGFINEGSEISGTFTGVQLGNGTFEATYSTLNGDNSSQDIVGLLGGLSWDTDWNLSSGTHSFDVDDNGNITHAFNNITSIFSSCLMTGTIISISNTHLYEVNVNITGCDNPVREASDFTGLATTKSITKQLVFAISDTLKEYAFGDLVTTP